MRRRYGFRPKPKKITPQYRVNERIFAQRVFVIDETGKALGEMHPREGAEIARSRELDLVEVSPKANPPVCKIIDYGKFQYQQGKQERLARAKSKKVEVKGVRIGLRTDEHDIDFKKSQVEKFLRKGNKAKIEIILKGREKAHRGLAKATLEDFVSKIQIPHKIEEELKRVPEGFNIIIAPE